MAMGSAGKVAIVLVALCSVMVVAQAKEYRVAWNFLVNGWGRFISFRAGDVLVFIYGQGAHNVVEVDEAGYNSCTPGAGAWTHTSGRDRITLHRGINYFICTFPGHCNDKGMKMKVTAY